MDQRQWRFTRHCFLLFPVFALLLSGCANFDPLKGATAKPDENLIVNAYRRFPFGVTNATSSYNKVSGLGPRAHRLSSLGERESNQWRLTIRALAKQRDDLLGTLATMCRQPYDQRLYGEFERLQDWLSEESGEHFVEIDAELVLLLPATGYESRTRRWHRNSHRFPMRFAIPIRRDGCDQFLLDILPKLIHEQVHAINWVRENSVSELVGDEFVAYMLEACALGQMRGADLSSYVAALPPEEVIRKAMAADLEETLDVLGSQSSATLLGGFLAQLVVWNLAGELGASPSEDQVNHLMQMCSALLDNPQDWQDIYSRSASLANGGLSGDFTR